jgi:hypothetical protein
MQVNYTITFADYEKASLAINDKIPSYNKAKFRYSLVIGIAFFLVLPFSSYALRFLMTISFYLLVYYILFDHWNRFYLKAMLHQMSQEKESKFPKEVILNINKKRFLYTSITDEKEISVPWANITTAVETSEMYILYTPIFSNYYIIKKENKPIELSEVFNQTIKHILIENYLPIQSPKGKERKSQ